VYLVSRHDSDNTGGVGDYCFAKRTAPGTFQHIMDLNLSGMGVVADCTAGIDPYIVEAQAPAGIFSRHQVPEKNTGKLRVGIP
jgi:ABC-type thiamine transport system substrate-binding protein